MSVRQLCPAQTTSCEVSDISSPGQSLPWAWVLGTPSYSGQILTVYLPRCQYQGRCVQLGRLCTAHLGLVAKTEGEEI